MKKDRGEEKEEEGEVGIEGVGVCKENIRKEWSGWMEGKTEEPCFG